MRIIIVLLLCLCAAGCQTQGAYLEEERMSEIQATVTNAEELYESLGAPSVTIPKANGKQLWIYEGVHTTPGVTQFIPYLNYAIGTNDQKCTKLAVLIDVNSGALEDWSYTSSTDTDHWTSRDETCEKSTEKDSKDEVSEPTHNK